MPERSSPSRPLIGERMGPCSLSRFASVHFGTAVIGSAWPWYETSLSASARRRPCVKQRLNLAHVARVATLGEMTASIAHEINQPLAAVVNNASACLRWLAAPTWRRPASLPR